MNLKKSKKKICKYCYGKKFYSVYKGYTVGYPDFIGEKEKVLDKGGIQIVPCPRCNKKGDK